MKNGLKKRTENVLLKAIVSSMPAGILVIETGTNIIRMMNEAAVSIFGMPEEALLDKKCPETLSSCLEKPATACERTVTRPDGTEVSVLRNSRVLSVGENQYRLESFVDITSRKQLERQSKEELERALQSSREYAKKADQASRSKSSFLASMSHEIRTPINGMLGFLSLLGETELSREQSDYLQNAENSTRILLALINDILDFSKIEAGKLDIEKIVFNLHDAVEETLVTFTPKAEEKKNRIHIAIHPEVPRIVKGDPNRFRQVLMNLCSNAVKFTSGGDIEVRVSATEGGNKKTRVRVDVSDDGIGLSPEKMQTIFSPFSQADPSVAREYGGSGLGLTISKQLVKMLRGDIWVESSGGNGSTFSFYIDFAKAEEDPPVPGPGKLGGVSVLLLTVNVKSRQVLEMYCREWGMEADSVPADSDRLPDLSSGKYRFVIVDSTVDRGPDRDVLQTLYENCPGGTDIVVSAYPAYISSLRPLEEELGAVFILKPVRKMLLREEMLRLLSSEAASCAERAETETAVRKEPDGKPREEVCILIAEDNKINQKLTGKILEKNGYSYDIAANGIEALELFREKKYSLILMDCLMPEMDGYVASLKIRRNEKSRGSRRVPIIALTANVMKGERQKVLAAGMDDYLAKPVNPKQMIEVVEQWLDNCRE